MEPFTIGIIAAAAGSIALALWNLAMEDIQTLRRRDAVQRRALRRMTSEIERLHLERRLEGLVHKRR